MRSCALSLKTVKIKQNKTQPRAKSVHYFFSESLSFSNFYLVFAGTFPFFYYNLYFGLFSLSFQSHQKSLNKHEILFTGYENGKIKRTKEKNKFKLFVFTFEMFFFTIFFDAANLNFPLKHSLYFTGMNHKTLGTVFFVSLFSITNYFNNFKTFPPDFSEIF